MTQIAEPLTPAPKNSAPGGRPAVRRRGRWPVVIVLIAALIGCEAARDWASDWKDNNSGPHPLVAERGTLSGMDSYALALMLGGMRGPLVMVLWSKVENQKIDRDLEDVDTMIEWIRLLQPEFDTVHIFQIWNKAYNISAMMASTASKYTTVLDAVDYARRVDAGRPGDVNILDSLAQVFAEKLGGTNVAERNFYRKQFREDSLTEANRKVAFPDDKNYHRLGVKYFGGKNAPLLDAHNDLLPELIAPRYPRPANLPADSEWNDGSELQYLKPYEPFPYGLSPTAMGYNYAKRAQVAMTVGGQKPLQLSDTVVDSRPGLLLKDWAEREQERARLEEAHAFGISTDADKAESATSVIAPNASVGDLQALRAAVYGYGLSNRLCRDALKEYRRHLANSKYVNPFQTYASHIDDLMAMEPQAAGDRAYSAMFLPGADVAKLRSEAIAAYKAARAQDERILFKYYTEAPLADILFRKAGPDLSKLDDQTLENLYQRLLGLVSAVPPQNREYEDQRNEYGSNIYRCDIRLAALGVGPKAH